MKRFLLIAAAFFSVNAHAFFCPDNFNIVSPGATQDEVKNRCGTPAAEKSYALTSANTVGTWEYVKPSQDSQFTSKLTFAVSDNKVANITIEKGNAEAVQICQAMRLGAGSTYIQMWCNHPGPYTVTNTNLCGGVIRLGDSVQTVEYLCGKPLTAHQERPDDPTKMVTEYTYTGTTPATFLFLNGKLTERR